ncbi:hypothetical protein AALP_AA8G433900 [Arabis alpina]|uniref:F-box domain-containing protein n=1 Tax=Arabis alpina TaxID=50452 RepID=A0A087GD67_ARAAL|nr:hypothetical protein AALP_AA8G433900 [Arabis alpina]
METPNSSCWSELPMDILRSVLERLSFVDFHRAKIVCPKWYLCSKQTLLPKTGSPWLILFPEDGCVLYNPDEDRVYKPKNPNFSGFRFLASSGKWFLVVDPGLNLSIIDLFSERKIDLPPLESIEGATATYILERVNEKVLTEFVFDDGTVMWPEIPCGPRTAEDLRGLLWVDDGKSELEYVVVWRFVTDCHYLGFCKNGYDHHLGSPIRDKQRIRRELRGMNDMVLKGDTLYILTPLRYIRVLSIRGQDGIKDISHHNMIQMFQPELIEIKQAAKFISDTVKLAVTRSGEVLMVDIFVYEDATATRRMIFRLCKRDPTLPTNSCVNLSEVDSLGDEALLLDSGITVPADKSLGIEPNSIYFTRDDRVFGKKPRCFDICVYNIATKTIKRFDRLSDLNLKDALWVLPS